MTLQSNGQYIINIDDVLNNSELTETELTEIYGERIDEHLINASNKIYNIMFSASPHFYRKRNADYIKYVIQNDTDKQNAIRAAIIEYVRGAWYSGMDLRAYENDKEQYSPFVKDILKENDLWIVSQIQYNDSDIE